LAALSFFIASIVLIAFFISGNIPNSAINMRNLRQENNELRKKLIEVELTYNNLRAGIDSLAGLNSELRISANLNPITPEERLMGIGGESSIHLAKFGRYDIALNNAEQYVDEMIRKFEFEKIQYKEISDKLTLNKQLYECIPALKPTIGEYTVDGFGMRRHPILGINRFHSGLDINNNAGTPVYAPGNGKVISVGRKSGYGLAIEIDHGFGYKTIFAHLSKTQVKRGQKIKRGDLIANTGNSGLSSGPHLHYEVHHNGVVLNPIDFFFDDINYFELNNSSKEELNK
jgi:murein DD-endopeptidase MepM/ murein hydrolase activator NlpD